MAEVRLGEQLAKLYAYTKGFGALYLINAGIEIGLFDKLNSCQDGASPETLANQLGLYEPYVRIWCQTAYHLEILECAEDGRFTLAPHMNTLLADTSSPYYFGHWPRVAVYHFPEMHKKHSDYYKSGQSEFYNDYGQDFSRDAKALSDQIIPTIYIFMAIHSITGLRERLDGGVKILDVGCGSGLLMVAMAKAYPNCSFVGIDVDKFAVEDAQRRIKENGVENNVSALYMDAASSEYSEEFDLVNLAVTLHEVRPDIREESIANCYKALKPSGQIVIFEMAYPERLEDFRKSEYTLVIMEQFFELTFGCKFLPMSAKHKLLLDHGFKGPETIPLAEGISEITYASK
jgi:SAM-dependent methyltransferase